MMAQTKGLLIQTIKNVTIVNFVDSAIMDTLKIQELAGQLYDLVDKQNIKRLILDFSQVRFLSSQTLGVLLNLRKKMDAIKGRLVICGMRKELHKLFRITRVDKIFDFYDNEQQALNSFGVYTVG